MEVTLRLYVKLKDRIDPAECSWRVSDKGPRVKLQKAKKHPAPTTMTIDEREHYTDDPEAPGLPGSSAELVIALLRQAERAEDRESAKQVAAALRRLAGRARLDASGYTNRFKKGDVLVAVNGIEVRLSLSLSKLRS